MKANRAPRRINIYLWIKAGIFFVLAFVIIGLTYGIYHDGEEKAYVQKHSPVVKVPIVGRQKGSGTLRAPNKIHVSYLGKTYYLSSSNRHFRKTARQDSIEIRYDFARDMAVLTVEKVSAPYFPLVALLFGGLLSVGTGVYILWRGYRRG